MAPAQVIDDDDRVLMLWRHRFVPDAFGWESPGGIMAHGENGTATAAREAEEETGWRPSSSGELLISFQPMPGMVDTPHEVYLFQGAEHIARWLPPQ